MVSFRQLASSEPEPSTPQALIPDVPSVFLIYFEQSKSHLKRMWYFLPMFFKISNSNCQRTNILISWRCLYIIKITSCCQECFSFSRGKSFTVVRISKNNVMSFLFYGSYSQTKGRVNFTFSLPSYLLIIIPRLVIIVKS